MFLRALSAASIGALTLGPPALAQDNSWMNGVNPQPSSPLRAGPLAWTLMVDTYYGYAFNAPADNTVFPTTTAPRHNEVNLNLGLVGVEVVDVPDVVGKLVFQTGNYIETITGTDPSGQSGAYGGLTGLRHVQQAYAGYRLDAPWKPTLMMGLFPAFIGLDAYWPQENWSYTHALPSDFTPYYLSGAVLGLQPRDDLKAELWAVNGWQTLSRVGASLGFGYSTVWRANERLQLTHNFLGGRFEADPSRWRSYFDQVLQWRYADRPVPGVEHLAIAAVADIGFNTAGAQQAAGWMGGGALQHRVRFGGGWANNLRASFYHDPQQLVALGVPGGASLSPGALSVGEFTATLDYSPSPWLLYRLEVRRDIASIPYIAGPGGVTGAAPDFRQAGDRVVFNTTLRL